MENNYADIVILGADIFYGSSMHRLNGAIAINGGKIIYVGDEEAVKRYICKDTLVIDALGRTVLPGLIDSHIHLIPYGLSMQYIDLRNVDSIDSMKELIRKEVSRRRPVEWIIGRGWDQERFTESRYPNRHDIDDVAPENPVLLIRICGHIALANTMALKMAGIDQDTQDPPGGIIERDSDGYPTGILKENAIELVRRVIPRPTPRELMDAAERAINKCLEKGVTTVHFMSALPEEIEALYSLHKSGRLKIRVRIYVDQRFYRDVLEKFGRSLDGEWIRINGVKIFADGSFGGRTAALREPYSDKRDTSGKLIYTTDELCAIIDEVASNGMQLAIHGIGDLAIETILSAMEKALGPKNIRQYRHRIEHGSLMPPDLVEKASKLGVVISTQPGFIKADFWLPERLGVERVKHVYNFRTLLNNGIVLCAGSDAPVDEVEPLIGIYLAVSRGGPSNKLYRFSKSESIGLTDAIKMYSTNAAYAGHDEDKIGSIEQGKYADLIILDRRINNMEDLLDARVWMAIVDGKIVYERLIRGNS